MSLEDYINYGFTWGEIYDMSQTSTYNVIGKSKIPELYRLYKDDLWLMAWEEYKACSMQGECINVLHALSLQYAASDVESHASFEEWFLSWGIIRIASNLIARREEL